MSLGFNKRKRRKIDDGGQLRQNLIKQGKYSRPSGPAEAVLPIDQLAWKEVPFPEHFEDAEGFFGLEEVSDVEVNRVGDSGEVEYAAASKRTSVVEGRKSAKVNGAEKLPDEYESDEWDGFGDDMDVGLNELPPKKSGKKVQVNGTRHDAKATQSRSASFNVLDDEPDEGADVSAWSAISISDGILSSLSKLGFSSPTPIQQAAIPEILQGHDVVGKAATGSGKTLAFGIPIFEHLAEPSKPENAQEVATSEAQSSVPAALIISPTRELAVQLSKHLNDLGKHGSRKSPSIATVTGGLSVYKQQRLLKQADIVIGTPGRLWEVMGTSPALMAKMRQIKFLVLDEADRLLSEGHFKELSQILNGLDNPPIDANEDEKEPSSDLPPKRWQTLVFSATFERDLQQKLAKRQIRSSGSLAGATQSMEYLLKKLNFGEAKPRFIDVNPAKQVADNLTEALLECPAQEKDLSLYTLLLCNTSAKRVLIFVNSIASVRRLALFLQNLDMQAHALHSQMQQKARLRSVERFSSSSSTRPCLLIATDVAARGLDIPDVPLVIHFHAPRTADMYIHRSGRTARATKSGLSILLCSAEEVSSVHRLMGAVHARYSKSSSRGQPRPIKTIELDRQLMPRVKPRVSLSQKLTNAAMAKEKHHLEQNWLRTAAEEIGVDYDSDEFAAAEHGPHKGKRRGQGRMLKEKEAREVSKTELAAAKTRLREELGRRINTGVSERYLTAGGIDVNALLRASEASEAAEQSGRVQNAFLGTLDLHHLLA